MSAPITIRMTLTGALEGKTKLLNRHQFINGLSDFTGQKEEIEGVTRYFTRSYQVKISKPGDAEVVEPDPALEAVKEDDDVLGLEEKKKEVEEENKIVDPNARQQEIIAAINGIDREEWVDKHSTPRPKVKDVSMLMEDPTVSKVEIVEVIEKWLS